VNNQWIVSRVHLLNGTCIKCFYRSVNKLTTHSGDNLNIGPYSRSYSVKLLNQRNPNYCCFIYLREYQFS